MAKKLTQIVTKKDPNQTKLPQNPHNISFSQQHNNNENPAWEKSSAGGGKSSRVLSERLYLMYEKDCEKGQFGENV